MCKIRLKVRFRHLTFISAYAPTEEVIEDDNNAFYDILDRECSKIPKYDVFCSSWRFKRESG